ncbi:MAG: hypothetical protein IH899_19070 [Planctomycetes bacterium]|nr:hypothetical protein [Planctomycetota bacterium]
MRRFFLLTVLLVAGLPSLSGCRLRSVESAFLDNSLSAELLDAVSFELNRDVWSRDTSWTPKTSVVSQPKSDRRTWNSRLVFGDQSVYDLLNQIDALSLEQFHNSDDAGTKAVAPVLHEDSTSRVIPSKIHSEIAKGTSPNSNLGNRYLTALARRDDLSGWNAAIILAQRDPRSTAAFSKTLKELATTRLYYDHETKQRVDGPIPALRPERDERTTRINPKSSRKRKPGKINSMIPQTIPTTRRKISKTDSLTNRNLCPRKNWQKNWQKRSLPC